MTEAARWRLTNPHYINVETLPDGTEVEWESKETNRDSGRTIRKTFKVPMLLNPIESGDCNYPGEIIVANAHSTAYPQDYIFNGVPTPEMEPLNDAAQAISDGMRSKWDNPIESLPANGGMNVQEQAFFASMMKAFETQANIPNTSVPKEEYDALKERLAKLEALIATQPIGRGAERRA